MGTAFSSTASEATENTSSATQQRTNSKSISNANASKYKNIVIDDAVKAKIGKLDTLVNTFNNNDVKSMIVNMSSQELYKDVLTPELVAKVTDMHNKILARIGDDKIGSNAMLRNTMYNVVNEDTDRNLAAFLQDPAIGMNPKLRDEVMSLTGSIKTVGTRYKYFEYKYIQLNLFVIGFIQHVYSTMQTFMETNMEYFEAREKYRTELTTEFIQALKKLLEQNDLNISEKEMDDLNRLANAMKQDVNEKRAETKEKMMKVAEANIKSIDSYVEKYKDNIYKADLSPPVNAATNSGKKVVSGQNSTNISKNANSRRSANAIASSTLVENTKNSSNAIVNATKNASLQRQTDGAVNANAASKQPNPVKNA
jgi:hypothetical protein